MQLFVTGSEGYIGSVLTDRHQNCIGFDLKRGQDIKELDNVPPVGLRVDAVVHLAAIASIPECETDPFEAYQTNVYGTAKVIDFALRNRIPRFVLASSCAVRNPTSHYAKSKAAAESYLWAVSHLFPNGAASLRFANVAGREGNRARGRFIPSLIDAYVEGKIFEYHSQPDTERNFVHVDDVADACIHFAGIKRSGTFDICADRSHTLRQVVAAFSEQVGKLINTKENFIRANEAVDVDCSPLAARLMGWHAKRNLDDILRSSL